MRFRQSAGLVITGALWAGAAVVPAAAQNVTRLPQQDQAVTGSLATVFSVGRDEGEHYEVFSNVPGVAFDADGNLYVVDRDEGRILVFAADGRFLRQIGRQGEGPGELRIPLSVAVTTDGRVAVFDIANRAISLFDRDGTYRSLVRTAPEYGTVQAPIRAWAGGGLVIAGSQVQMERGGPPTVRDSLPLLLVSLGDPASTRVLVEAASPAPVVTASGTETRREMRMTPPPTFSPAVSWSPAPDNRLAVVTGVDWRVRLVSDGGAVTVLERPIRARAVTERDREAARQARREALASGAGMMRVENNNGRERMTMGGGGLPPDQVERLVAEMEFAPVVPVVRGLRTDADGRIWVEREGGPGATSHLIDIVSRAGAYIGTLRGEALPDAFGPRGLAAFITADDLGVQRVVVKRIPQGWRR